MKKKYLILIITILQYTFSLSQNDADLDNTFNLDASINNTIKVLYKESNNKIIIYTPTGGGNYSIKRLNIDGTIDNNFSDIIINGWVYSIDKQSNGKIIISHNGNKFNETSVKKIIRLNSDWSLDNSFDSGIDNSQINVIKVQNNDKILYGGDNTGNFGRLNINGSIDNTFNIGNGFYRVSGLYSKISNILIDENNKILIGGRYDKFNNTSTQGITRLNEDGSIDTTFNQNELGFNIDSSFETVTLIKIQKDGKILVTGNFSNYNNTSVNKLVRLKNDGKLDNNFIPRIFSKINSIAIQNDDKIIIGGEFISVNSETKNKICRLNSDGTNDNIFNVLDGFDNNVNDLFITESNKVLVSGIFTTYQGNSVKKVIQLLGNSNSLSVSSFKKENLVFYPNPSKNKIFIPLSKNNNLSYKVYSILGKEVYSGILTNDFLDISELTKGIYYVYLKNNSEEIKFKIIKN